MEVDTKGGKKKRWNDFAEKIKKKEKNSGKIKKDMKDRTKKLQK